jgi:hypothetical protein
MKTLSVTIILLALTFSAVSTQAQTADEIVNKYIAALGGKDAIKSVKTIYEEGSLNVMGNEAPSTTYIVDGKGFKNQVDLNGQQIVQVVTDHGGWSINPGQTTATPLPEEQAKTSRYQLDIGGPLLDYKTKGSKIELIGKDTACGGTYKLKLTTKDSMSMTLFIDINTSLLDRMTTKPPGMDAEIVINFSNFKKVDGGFVMPYTQEVVLPQITLSMTSKKVEINKAIDPTIFDMPK